MSIIQEYEAIRKHIGDGDVITRTIDIDEAETESRLVEYDLKEKEI